MNYQINTINKDPRAMIEAHSEFILLYKVVFYFSFNKKIGYRLPRKYHNSQ